MSRLSDEAAAEADVALVKDCGLSGSRTFDRLGENKLVLHELDGDERSAVAQADLKRRDNRSGARDDFVWRKQLKGSGAWGNVIIYSRRLRGVMRVSRIISRGEQSLSIGTPMQIFELQLASPKFSVIEILGNIDSILSKIFIDNIIRQTAA